MGKKESKDPIVEKLDVVISLLQHLLATELHRNDVPKDVIGRKLCVAKSTVVKMLDGINKKK